MFDSARRTVARWIAPPAPVNRQQRRQVMHSAARMYANAKDSRLTNGWQTPNNSADSELISSLQKLRSRSRALVRDASYAKRAKIVVVNNVIGTGIGMQAQVKTRRGDKLDDDVNAAIEREWADWCKGENCHTGGRLHFSDMERQLMGQVFEAGEIFVRKHYRKFGRSRVPLALEVVEPERLAEEYTQAVVNGGAIFKMGIEQDEFGRPLAFWMRRLHPSEIRQSPAARSTDFLYRVPASQVVHLACVDRWPQTRGEPWLHAAARRLNDMDGYSEAEIVAARGAASYMGIITSDEDADNPPPDAVDTENPTETPQFDLEPGLVEELQPGKKFEFVAPNRPNPNMDPFMRLMLREVAAGSNVSYESISRDHSQSNFSSSRMGQQDDRDTWTVLQQWFIRSFREALHAEWLQSAVMAGAIPEIDLSAYAVNPKRYEAVTFKPRGWTYINPKEDIEAAERAIRAGLSTRTHQIARYGEGMDVEDIDDTRKRELEAAKAKQLVYTTDPEEFANNGAKHPQPTTDSAVPVAEPAAPAARVMPIREVSHA